MTDNKDSPHEYYLTVRSSEPIPHDVLVEHLAVALRDFKQTKTLEIQMSHPFADKSNVVFDDTVKTEDYTGPVPRDPYPLVTRALDFLRGEKRG